MSLRWRKTLTCVNFITMLAPPQVCVGGWGCFFVSSFLLLFLFPAMFEGFLFVSFFLLKIKQSWVGKEVGSIWEESGGKHDQK